jgi:hypothetical protein
MKPCAEPPNAKPQPRSHQQIAPIEASKTFLICDWGSTQVAPREMKCARVEDRRYGTVLLSHQNVLGVLDVDRADLEHREARLCVCANSWGAASGAEENNVCAVVQQNSRMKNTRIAPMRSHIESASLTLRPNGSGAAVGDAVVVVASKSARADILRSSVGAELDYNSATWPVVFTFSSTGL